MKSRSAKAPRSRTLTEQDSTLFAVMSGDINPAHVDPEFAMKSRFREVIGRGIWSGALISTVLGTVFPGPGTVYLGQNLRFCRPVKVGDTITIKVTAKEKDDTRGKLVLDTECTNQDGEAVLRKRRRTEEDARAIGGPIFGATSGYARSRRLSAGLLRLGWSDVRDL